MARQLHVLLTTQVFPPEIHPTAVMAEELVRGLVARDLRVTVAAGLPHHPTGEVAPGYARRLRQVEQRDGYRVVRLWHPTTKSRAIAGRAFVMATQMISTAVAAATSGRPDVVISFGGPPLVGPVLTGMIAHAFRAPLITVIHDIYPDVAVESGSVRSPAVIAPARILERMQYRFSDHLVVLGEATRNLLVSAKQVIPERISVLPVWLDPDEIRPAPRTTAWRREQGLREDDFVVLYSGTAGIISGAEVLEDVARRLPPDVVILLVGGGQSWRNLEARVREGSAPVNLRVLPYQPRERLAEVQNASDLSIVTLLPGRGRTSVPSKVQGYMAAGRPVLAAADGDCDTALLIQREGFGSVVAPADAQAIADRILELRADPARLAAMGGRARKVFERDHAREPLIDRYAALLRAAAGA